MFGYLKSENLKYKRTFSRKILIIAPLFIIAFALFIALLAGLENQDLLGMVFNWWPLFFMPLGTAILSSMAISKKNKSGAYSSILSRPLSLMKFWVSKIIIIGFYLLLTTLVLVIGISITSGGILSSYNSIPLIVTASLFIWTISICFIPLYLFLSSVGGAGAAIIVAVGGLFSGVIIGFWS